MTAPARSIHGEMLADQVGIVRGLAASTRALGLRAALSVQSLLFGASADLALAGDAHQVALEHDAQESEHEARARAAQVEGQRLLEVARRMLLDRRCDPNRGQQLLQAAEAAFDQADEAYALAEAQDGVEREEHQRGERHRVLAGVQVRLVGAAVETRRLLLVERGRKS